MPESRLDAAIANRGLARSRTQAARLIADGAVTVDGRPAAKPSQIVSDHQVIELAGADQWVSRAAHKLIAALDGFSLDVNGATALDVGASTGGFTQVLRARGAARVVSLDVGHGQLAPPILADDGVTVIEGVNARYLTRGELGRLAGFEVNPDIVVADLSFISLTQVLPALVDSVGTTPEWVLLIKPQFEVGRTGVREGIVHDAGLRAEAIESVLWAGWDVGLRARGLLSSPIIGSHGNHEYLVHLSAQGGHDPTEWRGRVAVLAGVASGEGTDAAR